MKIMLIIGLLTAACTGAAMIERIKPGNFMQPWKSRSIQSPKSVLCPDYTSPHELKWLRPRSRFNGQFLD